MQELEHDFNMPSIAIATMQDLIRFLQESGDYAGQLAAIERFQAEYGAV